MSAVLRNKTKYSIGLAEAPSMSLSGTSRSMVRTDPDVLPSLLLSKLRLVDGCVEISAKQSWIQN